MSTNINTNNSTEDEFPLEVITKNLEFETDIPSEVEIIGTSKYIVHDPWSTALPVPEHRTTGDNAIMHMNPLTVDESKLEKGNFINNSNNSNNNNTPEVLRSFVHTPSPTIINTIDDSNNSLSGNSATLNGISNNIKHVIAFAGLRGAVAFACVLMFPDNYHHQLLLVCTTISIIIITILIQGI